MLTTLGKLDNSCLIGGVSVLLHQQRLSIDLPLRATGDADFGLPPYPQCPMESLLRQSRQTN